MTLRIPDYTSKDGTVRLWCGDCLELLPEFDTESVDAAVTDPPYGVNTKSDGMGKLGPWQDWTNSALFYQTWIGQTKRIVGDCLWSCLNWRSLVTFQKASCDIGWPIESLLIWDKEWIGPGGTRGLRPAYECVALWCKPDFGLANRGLRDIQRFQWSGYKPNGHPAEKPVTLMGWCIAVSNAGSVLDPFMGSGTTGVACVREGRRFSGIESNLKWFDVAVKRIEEAFADQALFTHENPPVLHPELFEEQP